MSKIRNLKFLNLLCKGDLPSPTNRKFYSHLLSSEDMEDVIDADEYLQPYKDCCNHDDDSCSHVVTTHSIIRT